MRQLDLPTAFLRAEGAVLFGLAVFFYWYADGALVLFLVLFLVPDLGMIGYLGGPRLGAVAYNLLHTYAGPAALIVIGFMTDLRAAVIWALIWFAHIGLDRALGYGLKYPSGFRDTHLGRIGRVREMPPERG